MKNAKGSSQRTSLLEGEELKDALSVLQELPAIRSLDQATLNILTQRLIIRAYRSGALVVRHGEPGESCFIVIRGEVSARRVDAKGKELTFGTMGEGAIFGELSILTDSTRGADVVATTKSIIAELSAESFKLLLVSSPTFSTHVLTLLASRFRSNAERLNELSSLDLNQRLLLMLSRSATLIQIGKTEKLVVRELPSRQHIASLLSCSREAVSRSLRYLEEKGFIALDGDRVEVLEPIGLPDERGKN